MLTNKTKITILNMTVALLLCACAAEKVRIIDIGPGWSKTMVNATVFRVNSVVSHDGYQYVAYYDSAANVVLAKRKLGKRKWEIRKTQYTGNVLDAHNVISIMVDGDGYLHMAWDHHGHPLHYCKSVAPGSLQMGEKETMIGKGEDKVTYTEFYRMPSGDLIFAYRDGSSGNGNLTMNRYDLRSRKWARLHDTLIDGEGSRNAYWQIHVGSSGTIHLSWVWREHFNVETNHDMCYAASTDGGRTWQTSAGEKYIVPITEQTAEYAARIPQNSDLINQTSMTADERGNPYIATYYQSATDSCPQYYVIYKQDGHWRTSRATNRRLDFDLGGAGSRSIPVSRPQLLFRSSNGRGELYMIYRDEELQGKVCLATAALPDLHWKTETLTTYSLERWEPSYDTELWKKEQKLNLFMQKVGQGSGEKAVQMKPQMVQILELSVK